MPVYENGLILAASEITHDGYDRPALVTYALNDDLDAMNASDWADALQAAISTNFADELDSGAQFTRTFVTKGLGDDEPQVAISTIGPTAGTHATLSVPPNCAVLIRKNTGLGGRRNRGRCFFPWMGGADELGVIDAGDVSGIQDDANDWWDDLDALANGGTVIANRVYDLPWDDPNRQLLEVNIGAVVTSFTVEGTVATQRRRLVR